jgi:hypothetical protein
MEHLAVQKNIKFVFVYLQLLSFRAKLTMKKLATNA